LIFIVSETAVFSTARMEASWRNFKRNSKVIEESDSRFRNLKNP